MSARAPLRLAFYGDDFTGSTDALEFLVRAGLRTILFMAPPTPRELEKFGAVDAIGVAGLTRSLAPAAMTSILRPAFAALRKLGVRHVHYKVCSTFDSSPRVGSIGRAIDVGAEVFRPRCVPLLVGAPALGRYCVFGNLFARMGIGTEGEIHRLDRHPAMSRHPVTPMAESDLRRHLARQTRKRIGLLDVLQLERSPDRLAAAFDDAVRGGAEVMLLDVLTAQHLDRIGALLERLAQRDQPLFSVGSSAIEMALGARGTSRAASRARAGAAAVGRARPLLVISGSCSPVTAGQIAWAEANGFAVVPFGGRAERAASAALAAGQDTVICSSRGRPAREAVPARRLGIELGELARGLIARHGVRRLLLAGGDTSSYAARALGIEALELIAPLAPGAPLCRVHASDPAVHGLEVNVKGGQVGGEDYFGAVARGRR